MTKNTANLTSTDYGEDVQGSSWTWNQDDEGDSSSFGLTGQSMDYGTDALGGTAESNSVQDGDIQNNVIRFGFED